MDEHATNISSPSMNPGRTVLRCSEYSAPVLGVGHSVKTLWDWNSPVHMEGRDSQTLATTAHQATASTPSSKTMTTSTTSSSSRKRVIVVIPGNPGVVDFYGAFISHLAESTGMDALAVGHVGHCSGHHNDGKVFSLDDQVNHKTKFLRFVHQRFESTHGEAPEFMLIGHSVGTWISMQVMNQSPSLPVRRLIGAFPCIEDMGSNAGMLNVLFHPVSRKVAGLAAAALRAVPWLHRRVVSMSVPEHHVSDYVVESFDQHTVQNILNMAYDEARAIKALEHDLVERHLDRLAFVFGQKDKWSPISQYHSLKERYPDARIHLDDDGLPHAFVLHHSQEMAHKLRPLLVE